MWCKRIWQVLFVVLIALVAPVAAQETRGAITGRVTDASGAIVPGAQVEVTNVATGASFRSVTNEAGSFDVPYLLPGVYRVAVHARGFKSVIREGVELRVSDRLALTFTLEVGDVSESVSVTAEAPLLDVTTASAGRVIGQRQASELPVMGGNPFYLARLTGGVAAPERGNGQNPFDAGSGTTTIIVNGTRSGSSEVTLDGSPNMYNNQTAFGPPQDLVQEFKINTAAYDASQGHAAGAIINVSIRSGTNQLHGTGYLFDSWIRARPWFLNRWLYDPNTGPIDERKILQATPGWLHMRWGGTATGPVVIPKRYDGRNRTFWSFGYEGVKVRRETTFTGTVPTPEEKRGDFSALLALGAAYQIYDPATTTPAATAGRFQRLPLAGNRIPTSRLDPIAQKLLSYYPDPNTPGTADGRQNYFRVAKDNRLWGSYLGRLDHNFSQNHRAFLRLNANTWHQETQNMPTVADGNVNERPGYGLVLDDVYVFNPQLLLNVRYGLTYQNPSTTRTSQGIDLVSLGISDKLVREILSKNNAAGIAFPQVVIDGGAFSDLGASGGNSSAGFYQTWSGTLTKIAGTHSMRMGGEYRLLRESSYNFGNVAPRFEFASAYTRGPLDNSPAAPIGQGLASMLFGIPTGGRVDVNASQAEQSGFTALFFQDDWRVSSKLTVNAGLRYEYESPTTERYNRSIRGFDAATPNPVEPAARSNYAKSPIPEVPVSAFRVMGGLTFAGVGGLPRALWDSDRNNFAPRIGLAYQIAQRTVLRSGYGIFYDLNGIDRQDVNQGGFSQSTNIVPSLDNGLTFRATLANPFPDGIQSPPGAKGGLTTFLGRGISAFAGRAVNPYMQRWSLSVQHELPGRVLAQASYVGNRGSKLGIATQLNPVPAQYLSTLRVRDQATIDFLSTQVANPFAGIPEFAGTGLSGQRVARSQLLLPYPHFTGITMTLPAGLSYYHSLQVEVEKRISRGFMFQSSWTWSKFMEARNYLNDTDVRPEKVVSDLDFTHRLIISALYELPFGHGKKILPKTNRLLDFVVGGWQLQGWYEGESGAPLGFGNAIFNGKLSDIPLPVGQRRAERWFNTDAGFERNPQRQLASNIRYFPTRFSGIRRDGINNFDLSMFKNFRLRERWTMQFRMESYNALNHVEFDSPNTTPSSSAFGTITSERGHGQRQVTFAWKLLF